MCEVVRFAVGVLARREAHRWPALGRAGAGERGRPRTTRIRRLLDCQPGPRPCRAPVRRFIKMPPARREDHPGGAVGAARATSSSTRHRAQGGVPQGAGPSGGHLVPCIPLRDREQPSSTPHGISMGSPSASTSGQITARSTRSPGTYGDIPVGHGRRGVLKVPNRSASSAHASENQSQAPEAPPR